ncbi:unnamed protein product [Pleuronectes platessa]|uniref:Uncharacterized protein n=1 Tax=Pleuronectes platessa TaxID=8262 RepID=A0A9N7TUR2_PLEPL|nr:unnamed protein product [Pleuronectes platessa]
MSSGHNSAEGDDVALSVSDTSKTSSTWVEGAALISPDPLRCHTSPGLAAAFPSEQPLTCLCYNPTLQHRLGNEHLMTNQNGEERKGPPPTHDLTITFDNSVLARTQTARNLGVTLQSQLSLTANITATTRSCRDTLHNTRRRRPLLSLEAVQVLIQVLVQVLVCLSTPLCQSGLVAPSVRTNPPMKSRLVAVLAPKRWNERP